MSDQALEQSPEDSLLAFVDMKDEPPEDEEEPEGEEADSEEEAEEEGDSEEETPIRKLKLNWNGEEVEKDEAEVIALAQQGFDYTKKTQTLAEERKQIEQMAQAVKAQENYVQSQTQLQQTYLKEMANITAIDARISQFEQVDWNALSDSDPVQAQKLYIEYNTLQATRGRAVNELQNRQAQAQHQQSAYMAELVNRNREVLAREIPDWSAEKAAKIRENTKSYGFTDQELAGINDPRLVKVLNDAAQFRALMDKKPVVDKKVQGKPAVVKPGTSDTKTVARSNRDKMFSDLRKTGSRDTAARLLESFV